MDRFTSAVKKSLENNNHYAALYLSITIPDICARLEADNGRSSGNKYAAWFDTYMAKYYIYHIGPSLQKTVFLSGGDLYALRCSMLHEGVDSIEHQRAQERLKSFNFTNYGNGTHCNEWNNILQIDISIFCIQICECVEKWYEDFKKHHAEKTHRIDQLIDINRPVSNLHF